MKKTIKTLFILILIFTIPRQNYAQDIKKQLIGKTYQRYFYAFAFQQKATYTFFANKIHYQVSGALINDEYNITGKYQNNIFTGKDKDGNTYKLKIKIISTDKILIQKTGIDSDYEWVKKFFNTNSWREYTLKQN